MTTVNAGTTAEGKKGRYTENYRLCKLFEMLYLPLQMHHQPTPAYCHGDKDIVRDVWFGHRHQLPVQVDCFSCHPEEHSQEEVVHECRDHSTEHRNSS